jgi:hypothetical protein
MAVSEKYGIQDNAQKHCLKIPAGQLPDASAGGEAF